MGYFQCPAAAQFIYKKDAPVNKDHFTAGIGIAGQPSGHELKQAAGCEETAAGGWVEVFLLSPKDPQTLLMAAGACWGSGRPQQ